MSRYNRSSTSGIGYPQWTRAVKTLVIINVVAFVLQNIDRMAGEPFFTQKFGLTPALVTHNYYLWQLVTYIFLHDTGNFTHILFNMLGLWMFGSDLEQVWGSREFTKYFFICGIAAGLLTVALSPNSNIPTIGASGAIYGILAAFALLFPHRIIYWIIFPIPAWVLASIFGGIALLSSVSSTGSGVAHVAHLGGMLCGVLYLKGGRLVSGLKWRYDRWQRVRLRKKFDVYYNDRQRDDNERWRRWR